MIALLEQLLNIFGFITNHPNQNFLVSNSGGIMVNVKSSSCVNSSPLMSLKT